MAKCLIKSCFVVLSFKPIFFFVFTYVISNLVIFFNFDFMHRYRSRDCHWYKNSNRRINNEFWSRLMTEDWDLGECKECYTKMVGLPRNRRLLSSWPCLALPLAHACCHAAVNRYTVLCACVIHLKAKGFVLDQKIISIFFLLTIVFFFQNK